MAVEVSDRRSAAGVAAWARRPNDTVFSNVTDLVRYTKDLEERSFEEVDTLEELEVRTPGDSLTPGVDQLYVTRHQKPPSRLNHLSFNQFCQNIKARASEYRKLPAYLAQVPLTYLACRADRKDVKLLHTQMREEDGTECRAITSPTYGRIWNYELAESVESYISPEIWTVPKKTAFHEKTGFITADERNCFIFMVDETHPIQAPGGQAVYRGFYAWNSEVLQGSLGIAEFLYFKACANRCIVGLSEFKEVRLRHTAGAPRIWMRDVAPQLKEYCNSSPKEVQARLQGSTKRIVSEDEKGAREWLAAKGFTKNLSAQILKGARDSECGSDPNSSPFSRFNLAMGLTSVAREEDHNDQRVELERRAGTILRGA